LVQAESNRVKSINPVTSKPQRFIGDILLDRIFSA
jgi:hypothetical protein